MTNIEEFIQKLDEVLYLKEELIKKQEAIDCDAVVKSTVFVNNAEKLLEFAQMKNLNISDVEKFQPKRCSFFVEYNGHKLHASILEKEYISFRERGLLR